MRLLQRLVGGRGAPVRAVPHACAHHDALSSPQVNEARSLRDKLNKTLKKALKQREAEAEAARAAEATAKEKARVLSAS